MGSKSNTYSTADSIDFLIREYQYDKALVLVERVIQQSGPSKDLYFLKGSLLKGLFSYSRAIDSYLSALSLDSLDNHILVELAATYRQIPDYTNSMKYFQLALNNDTSNLMLRIECANCKYYLDLFGPAAVDFEKIYRADSSNYFVIKRLALCYNKLDQMDTSIYFYKKAIQLNPLDASNVINLCNLLILSKNYPGALLYSEYYRSMNTSNNTANSQNAYIHLLNKNYYLAISRFKNCIQNQDTSKFVYKNLGITYFRLGEIDNFDTAKYYLEKAYFMDTTDVNALHFLGLACSQSYYKNLGVYYLEKAINHYSLFISEYSTIYRNLVEACRTWSDCPCEKTLAASIKAYELNPSDSTLLFYIGSGYDLCKSDKKNAAAYYEKFLKTRPADIDLNDAVSLHYFAAELKLKEWREEAAGKSAKK